MAEDNQRAEKYIVNIPYSVLLSIYQSLDADKGWEKLAAEVGYTFDKIRLLELEGWRNQGSPSRSLLWELGSRNTTVRQLYCRLSALGRYREMKTLEDYGEWCMGDDDDDDDQSQHHRASALLPPQRPGQIQGDEDSGGLRRNTTVRQLYCRLSALGRYREMKTLEDYGEWCMGDDDDDDDQSQHHRASALLPPQCPGQIQGDEDSGGLRRNTTVRQLYCRLSALGRYREMKTGGLRRNTTVRQLYCRLSYLGRYREMKTLEDYVHNPSNPSFTDNGLKGLPDVAQDSSSSLKGLSFPFTKKANTSSCSNNNSVQNNSININQQTCNSDVNISMKCQQTDKCYPGKQMPFPSPSSSPTASSEMKGIKGPPSHSCIAAPAVKPSMPSGQGMTAGCNVNLVQNMIKQISGGASSSSSSSSPSSSSSSGRGLSKFQTPPSGSSPSSSSPSPLSDGQFSSSVSSLPGLESSFEQQVALMSSASFTFAEVLQATNGFSERNKLGEGAFGKVYFGVLRQNKCAVKKLSDAENQESVVERSTQIKRELTSLLKFRHENIVMLYGYAVDGESLCLIYQYMPNGSLEDRLMCKKNTSPLIWSQRLNIMVGACQGLNFLHTMGDQPLIHGDIKSANILLDKYLEAKIGDLGQAQQASGREGEEAQTRRASRTSHPREVQTGSQPSTKSDVFALGVVLLEVFSGERAFDERREGEQFLADYFRSLKMESGDAACVSKLDRRGGECVREVCLALLNLADTATSHLKRTRPDSSKMLQKMTEVEDLYTQKTGIKHMGVDSLPGSEHSCHLSHCSSPAASLPNLTGAPSHHTPLHRTPSPQPGKPCNNDFSVNVNSGQPTEKHYAMHMPHEKRPNSCLTINVNSAAAAFPESCAASDQCSMDQPSLSSSSSFSHRSPIDYFQKGQPLPPAFRLQKAYDSQSELERRKILRLSQCQPTTEPARRQEGADCDILPQADPAKLAALEQFDRENLHGSSEEKESNCFQSDPKKLATLKQFDAQVQQVQLHQVQVQEELLHTQHQALPQENNLASDPKKLAQLRLFDQANVQPASDQASQREQGDVLPSDPRKLAALTHFDARNGQPDPASGLSDSDRYRPAAGTQCNAASYTPALPSMAGSDGYKPAAGQPNAAATCSPGLSSMSGHRSSTQDPFPVSQLDYVVSSQKEALDSCLPTGFQAVTPQSYSLSTPRVKGSVNNSVQDTPPQVGPVRMTPAVGGVPGPSQGSPQVGPVRMTPAVSGVPGPSQGIPQVGPVRMTPAVGDVPGPSQLASSNFTPSPEGPMLSSNFTTSEEALLRRQRNFFDMYSKALEEEMDDDDDGGDFGNANNHFAQNSEAEENSYVESALQVNASAPGEMCSLPVHEQVVVGRREGHCHPIPTEQDESFLSYFKQREQHYSKTFSKSQTSQC
ncbi:hypothetical protein ACOMHN_026125 [Nucella lapillus]